MAFLETRPPDMPLSLAEKAVILWNMLGFAEAELDELLAICGPFAEAGGPNPVALVRLEQAGISRSSPRGPSPGTSAAALAKVRLLSRMQEALLSLAGERAVSSCAVTVALDCTVEDGALRIKAAREATIGRFFGTLELPALATALATRKK